MSVYPLFYKRIYLILYLKSNKVMFIQCFYENTKYLHIKNEMKHIIKPNSLRFIICDQV